MASSAPLQLAETIQTAHINRQPSPSHDINPSTAADKVEPVSVLEKEEAEAEAEVEEDPVQVQPEDLSDGEVDVEHEHVHGAEEDVDDEDEDDDIPYSVLRPTPRRHSHLPPLPDLRFEQSYLHSIAQADTWWKVAWITTRDQVMMPLAQGVLYNLAICGWQFWNKNAQMHGSSAGARLRRWWYGVNNWIIPPEKGKPRSSRAFLGLSRR